MKRTEKLLTAGLTLGLVVVLQSGCAGTATVTQTTVKPEAIPLSAAEPAAVSEIKSLSGKVVETMNAGGYTYVNLEKDGKTSWVALPVTKVIVGQEIEARPGMQMGKFTSKSLNKTFEDIIFSSGLVTDTKDKLPQDHPPIDAKLQDDQKPSAPDGKTKADTKGHTGMMGMMAQGGEEMAAVSGKVMETMDAGGYTYINLDKNGKQTWVAVPNMKVTVGEEIELEPGAVMKNFTSKSLNKTFDSVIFSGGPAQSK